MDNHRAATAIDLGELARHFDVNDPRLNANFYETLQWMRERGPVHFSEAHGGYWVVVGHQEVVQAARDWRRFSSADGVVVAGTKPQKYVPVEYDPPHHQSFRRMLNPQFTRQVVEGYEPALRAFADSLIDKFVARGSADLSSDYAKPLAAYFFFNLFFRLAPDEAILCEEATNQAMFSAKVEDQMIGFGRLETLVSDVVERRKDSPSDGGFIDAVRTSLVDGRPVTDGELNGIIQLMIVGGDDTAVHTMGHLFFELACNPTLCARLAADLSYLPVVIEETIRHMSPAVSIARTVVEDVELGGQKLRSGDKVALVWSSANRDDSVFPNAHIFDESRENVRQHIGFGGGIHKCIGEWIARSIVTVATEQLLKRIPSFTADRASDVEYRMGQSRGPLNVPVVFGLNEAPELS